ncbi:MAG: Mycofactocin binding protein MftB, partial [uncultured Blastococcus sp.]
ADDGGPVRRRPPLAEGAVGRAPPGAVRRAGLPLRQPETVLPQVEAAGGRRRGAVRAPERRRDPHRLRRGRGPAARLREGAGRPRPLADDRIPGDARM